VRIEGRRQTGALVRTEGSSKAERKRLRMRRISNKANEGKDFCIGVTSQRSDRSKKFSAACSPIGFFGNSTFEAALSRHPENLTKGSKPKCL
jgi:hypothetical protein